MRWIALPLALLTLALCAPIASADVLIDTSDLSGACPTLGIWYQSFSGGPRTITATVLHGEVLIVRRHLTATTRWTKYVLACPEEPGRYIVRIEGAHWHSSYRVRVFGSE